MSSFGLTGRVAMVTGAAAGIGAAIARRLAGAGAEVLLIGRRAQPLDALADELAAAGHACRPAACDVTDIEALRGLIDELPRLDILVNNAGVNIPKPLEAVTPEDYDTIMNVNVRAAYFACQAAAAKMREHLGATDFGASIINVSSQMGHVGAPERSVYCASKHAVEGMTKALAVELAGERIRVNSLAPTFVDTPLIQRILDTPEKRAALVDQIPMGAMAEPEDVAAAALFLAAPAAGFVTGTSLKVDGGWTAR